jgi:aspartate/methionine/tyrosine aminotransferase
MGNIQSAHGVPVPCRLHESLGFRYDLDELAETITPRTRAIYVNSPHNPTGGVLTPDDIARIAELAREHRLWIVSDEAYEDIVYDDARHVSIGALEGMADRTISLFTFSKSYAMTGLRLGYVVARDPVLLERMKKVLFYTASNIASVVQYGGIGALEGPRAPIDAFRRELAARRDLFFARIGEATGGVLTGARPRGAFYAFLRIDPRWWDEVRATTAELSPSWAFAEQLIRRARIGCVPGVDFGPAGEGYLRFCFARERTELDGALDAMQALFASARI